MCLTFQIAVIARLCGRPGTEAAVCGQVHRAQQVAILLLQAPEEKRRSAKGGPLRLPMEFKPQTLPQNGGFSRSCAQPHFVTGAKAPVIPMTHNPQEPCLQEAVVEE